MKMNLKENGCEGLGSIKMVRNRVQWNALVNTVIRLRVPCSLSNYQLLKDSAP
jgi:hypothetical protein